MANMVLAKNRPLKRCQWRTKREKLTAHPTKIDIKSEPGPLKHILVATDTFKIFEACPRACHVGVCHAGACHVVEPTTF